MVVIKEFPRATELNNSLYERVYENVCYGVKAKDEHDTQPLMTKYDFHKQNIKEVEYLTSWISRVLPDVSKNFACHGEQEPRLLLHSHEDEKGYNFNVNGFEIASCWGIHYKGKETLMVHNHFPALLAFIYYVRTPKGSAPIMIEKEYNAREGQCIFFLASQHHSMGQNESNGRCAIVGNIIYNDYIHYGG